ncbi:hypothetical protein ACFOZ7_10180 [Natribaculum luteum]|uniref:DUF8106 domain-containing protein n=1 Tax=Natribaculum luteum TaxID=1586232 RepID=A0ABD5NZF7_9EURY|nr:hypothetical protein [Natribaculum luteum]
MSSSPPRDRPPYRKSILFCPDCGHQSPVDGDWLVSHDSTGLTYRCPSCETAITTRPAPDRPTSVVADWPRLYAGWVRLWADWYRLTTPSLQTDDL